jgi:acyl-CoA thioesterase FadM
MEETEYGFLRSVGLSVVLSDERGKIGFPRRSTSFQIENPARFDDELKIGLTLREMDGVSLQYDFEIDCDSARVATGSFHVVCCRFPPDKPPYAILIPEFIMDRMSKYQ